jgi:hypothetical protein
MYVKDFKRAGRPERNRQQIQALDARVGIASRVERPSQHSARVAKQQTKRWLKLREQKEWPEIREGLHLASGRNQSINTAFYFLSHTCRRASEGHSG